ncbi:MAG: hypothetical protein C3F13_00780 [Anaerolineales bacterium]|nr:MAG: hypothetical protein C3F13_00780 [Anaerolineales bacterium]
MPARYTLDASLDYFAHTVSVTETVSYTNTTSGSLSDLVLVVEPNRWSGCYNLITITWQNGDPLEDYELDKAQLRIPLPSLLAKGQSLGLRLVYLLDLPEIPAPSEEIRPVPFGYSARQINLVDWYAYVPPYQAGEGWLTHPRWGFGEHQVYDVGDYDVRLSLAEPVEDLVIAASAPATQAGEQYSYHLTAARSFALSASNAYLVQSTSVGDVTVYSYSFSFDKAAGEQALHDTAQAVELYSSLLVPYPHATLSVVEADFLDGMEYDGLFFLSRGFYNLYDGTPQGYLTFIAAHETAHQWWYGLVGNDQALEPWLDEAMCTYMEHIFYERVYPDYQATSGGSVLDWWWSYRVDYYEPTGWVDDAIYDFQLFRPYRDAIYLNGAKFLEDLRSLMGDQAFFEFLKDYAVSEKHKVTTANDFFSILKRHTAQDLDGLLDAYFKTSY